ncbi:MAG: hypothetical protein U1F18_15900 [Steroidobacteraceae bacterium]
MRSGGVFDALLGVVDEVLLIDRAVVEGEAGALQYPAVGAGGDARGG